MIEVAIKIIGLWFLLCFFVCAVSAVIHEAGGFSTRDWPFRLNGFALGGAELGLAALMLTGIVFLISI